MKYILTDATDAPFDSLLYAVSLLGKPYPLLIPIPPGKKDINNDLARLVDFPSGTKVREGDIFTTLITTKKKTPITFTVSN